MDETEQEKEQAEDWKHQSSLGSTDRKRTTGVKGLLPIYQE